MVLMNFIVMSRCNDVGFGKITPKFFVKMKDGVGGNCERLKRESSQEPLRMTSDSINSNKDPGIISI